jgi:hypothetical protein
MALNSTGIGRPRAGLQHGRAFGQVGVAKFGDGQIAASFGTSLGGISAIGDLG